MRAAVEAGRRRAQPPTGMLLWLRGDQPTGAEDAAVASWPDLSGNGYTTTQGTSGNRPTRKLTAGPNSQPGVLFARASSHFMTTNAPMQASMTMWAVLKPTTTPAGSTMVGSSGTGGMQWRFDSGIGLLVKQFVTSMGPDTGVAYAAGTSVQRMITFLDGTPNSTREYYQGNTMSNTASGVLTLVTVGNTYILGRNGSGANEYGDFLLVDLIIYSRVLNSTERAAINAYGTARYGLAA